MSSSTDPENYSENIFEDLGEKIKNWTSRGFFHPISYFLSKIFIFFSPKTYLSSAEFFFQRGGGIFKENIHPSFLF